MVRLRIHTEEGAVTVIVALFITVLFAFVALSVDVARLYEERRGLVNSADLSALSAAQLLWKSEAGSEAQGQQYITYNPTINHPGAYNPVGGDVVEAKRLSDGSLGCSVTQNGSTGNYDCVTSTVKAPAFKWLFGSVLGLQNRALTVTSTAILGSGAVSGKQVFPWVLRDCPNSAQYSDEAGVSVTGCPYTFSDDFNGTRTTFDQGSDNFTGLQVPTGASSTQGDCPNFLMDGYMDADGGNSTYSAVMEGSDPNFWPCTIASGARLFTRGGSLGSTLSGALTARGANTTSCMNATSFNATFAKEGDGDGFVTVLDKSNPCLIVVAFGVHANQNATTQSNVKMTAVGAQKTVATGRFADFSGSNNFVVLRRLAYYYITNILPDGDPQGVYLRAINPTATLTGPIDKCPVGVAITQCAHHSIFVVKLIS
jgi:Flp pilus assembly protein TadG